MTFQIEHIAELVDFLRTKANVYGPVGDDRIVFDAVDGRELNLSRVSDVSPRNLFQPMTHYYLRFEDGPSSDAEFSDFDASPRIVVGMRSCDVAGLDAHDKVFDESDSYKALRDATTIVGVLCTEREATCF